MAEGRSVSRSARTGRFVTQCHATRSPRTRSADDPPSHERNHPGCVSLELRTGDGHNDLPRSTPVEHLYGYWETLISCASGRLTRASHRLSSWQECN